MSCIYGRYKNLILFGLLKKKLICYSIANCPSITSSTASCLSATAKLHFFGVDSKLTNSGSCPPPNRPTPQNVYYIS